MPLVHVDVNSEVVVHFELVRLYLRRLPPQSWEDLMRDALWHEDPGALQIVQLCRLMRANRKTRKAIWQLKQEFRRVHAVAGPRPPRKWYTALGRAAMAIFRTLRAYGFPVIKRHASQALTQVMRRRTRRAIGATGMVDVELPTLRQRADSASDALMAAIKDQEVVVWLDNWYWQRFRPDPEEQVLSLDVSAMAVLPLTNPAMTIADRTRSRSFEDWAGHSTLYGLHSRVSVIDDTLAHSMRRIRKQAKQIIRRPVSANAIRVPLDLRRPARPTLPWRPLCLSQLRVGVGVELLQVLEGLLKLQDKVGDTLTLLIDEKVHYSVMRLLYAPQYWGWDAAAWLGKVPVLYGAWHPYKHTLTVVYRAFLPVFTSLELQAAPRAGTEFKAARKVIFMEKMVAALLLARHTVHDEVLRAIANAATDGYQKLSQLRHK